MRSSKPKMFDEEPKLLEESDPSVRNEMYRTMQLMGVRPEGVADQDEAAEYDEWLNQQAKNTTPVQN